MTTREYDGKASTIFLFLPWDSGQLPEPKQTSPSPGFDCRTVIVESLKHHRLATWRLHVTSPNTTTKILNHRTRMYAYDCEICNSSFSDNKLFNEAHTNGRILLSTHGADFLVQMETSILSATRSHTSKTITIPFPAGGAGSSSQAFSTDAHQGLLLTIHSHYQASPN
jgi:hypothetical protein